MEKVELKDRLKKAMEIRDLKQVDLVERYGFDKGQLSSWLSGKYKPRQNNIAKLSNALSVDEAWLMGYDVPMESSTTQSQSSADNESLQKLSIFLNSHPESLGYLATLCKNERIENEYTEKSIAQKCDISLKDYLDFENSYKNIGVSKISSILSIYDFNISFILGFLAGATGSRNEIVDIMVSQSPAKDKTAMEYVASKITKMNFEQLGYLIELLEKEIPINNPNTQKFTKAMYDFHDVQQKDET